MYPKRKSPRLSGFDYSTYGYYFVTICTYDRKCILGKIVGEGLCTLPKMILNETGRMVEQSILYIGSENENYIVDKYVIMPNHIHIIIKLEDCTGGHGGPPLQKIIGRFKSYTTHVFGNRLWQRSYHDHIIRGEKDYLKIWNYIEHNTAKWHEDCFFTEE